MSTILTPLEGHQHVWHYEGAALPPADEEDNGSVICLVQSEELVSDNNPKGYGVAWYNDASDFWITTDKRVIEVEWWKVIQPVDTPLEQQTA